MDSDIIWIDKPIILFKYYYQFYPNKLMTNNEKYNSIVRLLLYVIIGIILFKLNKLWIIYLSIIIFVITLTGKTSIKCRKSTYDNPLANPLINENLNLNACSISKNDIKNNLLNGVYQDSNNSFIKHYIERTFYTVPETKYPNDNIKLANSLTNEFASSCKEKNINCQKDLDIRFNR